MKILTTISSLNLYLKIKDYIDGIVIGNDNYALHLSRSFSEDEMFELIKIAKEDDKEVIIVVNKMCEDSDFPALLKHLDLFVNLDVKFLFQDLGVLQILKESQKQDKGIYDCPTMVANYLDLQFYLFTGIDACSISLEIPIDDVYDMSKRLNNQVFYKVFGYQRMFHSKRKLISTYCDFIKSSIDPSEEMFLVEETRKQKYPIVENKQGTIIYRDYVCSALKEIEKIKDFKYLFLEDLFIPESIFLNVVMIFSKVLKNEITKQEALDAIERLEIPIEDGFIYEDTIYQKEEF